MDGRYFLSQDQSCHWYVIRADRRADWNEWVNLDQDSEEAWVIPNYASSIGGHPSSVEFHLAEEYRGADND